MLRLCVACLLDEASRRLEEEGMQVEAKLASRAVAIAASGRRVLSDYVGCQHQQTCQQEHQAND